MAFKRQGAFSSSKMEIIKETFTEPGLVQASSTTEDIICPHCHKVIGNKIGNVYYVADKKLVALHGQCPFCKKSI